MSHHIVLLTMNLFPMELGEFMHSVDF